jgi:hypothetical protein
MSRFGIVPTDVIRHPALTAQDKLVLVMLTTYADRLGWCWPSVATLATDCQLSERSVRYALKHLRELGVLVVKPNVGPDGEQTSNLYWVRGYDPETLQLEQGAPAQFAGEGLHEVHPNSTSKNSTSEHATTTTTTTTRRVDVENSGLTFAEPAAQQVYERLRRAHPNPAALDATLGAVRDGMTTGQPVALEAIGRALLELAGNGEGFNVSRLRGYIRGLERVPAAPTSAGGYKRRGGPVDEAAMVAKVDAILAERGVTL